MISSFLRSILEVSSCVQLTLSSQVLGRCEIPCISSGVALQASTRCSQDVGKFMIHAMPLTFLFFAPFALPYFPLPPLSLRLLLHPLAARHLLKLTLMLCDLAGPFPSHLFLTLKFLLDTSGHLERVLLCIPRRRSSRRRE
ncbi:hypothetical protein JVU11DRAFT_11364 [Chiua virens]|nr:hypothetical protein JVU11DRAFT_11364 [Chiua virens]